MGIFDDYDIDIDSVKESNFDVADGTYLFTIGEAEVLDGTDNKPDTTFFIIDYQLEDENGDAAGQKRSWSTLAENGDSDTRRAKQSVSFLKSDLLKLGIKGANLSDFDGSELVGKTGSLILKTGPKKNGKDGFQNIKIVHVDEDDAPEPAPAKKAPARKPAAKAAPAAEAADPSDDEARKARLAEKKRLAAEAAAAAVSDDDDDNPFGG